MINLAMLTSNKFVLALVIIGSFTFFLFVLSIVFSVLELKEQKDFSYKIKKYNEDFVKQALSEFQNSKTTRNLYEKIELLLSRSQLNYKYSWTVPQFCLLVFLIFLYTFYSSFDVLGGFMAAFVLGMAAAFLPIVTVEFIATRKGKALKGQILSFIPVLINNAKLTGGDIFRTIKNSVPKVKEPLKIYLQEFVDEYESGVSPTICFKNLRSKIADYRFTRIIDCLENHLYKGGNVVVTLSSINKEYLSREVEEDRRRKQNSSTAMGIYVSVVGNILILWLINMVLPEIITTLKENQIILGIVMINMLISVFIGYAATRIQTKES